MEEEWRPVVGWEGMYEVSSFGEVRSKSRVMKTKSGQVRKKTGKTLAGYVDVNGYRFVTLYRGGSYQRKAIHRMIAESFIDNPKDLPWVLHRDDNPRHNKLDNLRWGTPSENTRDSIRNGTHGKASRTHCPRVHPFNKGNTYVRNNGARRCRSCTLEQNRAYIERRDAKRKEGN